MKRIQGYPGTTGDTTVDTFLHWGHLFQATSTNMVNKIRDVAAVVGEDRLGYPNKDIGTHLIHSGHSGIAMLMYLGKCPVYMIMMIR